MAGFIANIGRSFTKAIFGKKEEAPVLSRSKSKRPTLQTLHKRYEHVYLSNWQYGGYSYVEQDPNKPEELWVRGMADYANPDDVISIAERENLPHVSLAGGFWEEIGYKGWGEKISIGEARKALAKARQHVLGKEHKPRAEYIWLRLGDVAEYEKFDSPYEAGKAVGDRLSVYPTDQEALSYRYRTAGVAIEPYFTGNNYVSLYWGDEDAQWVTDLTNKERKEFERGVEEECGLSRRSELPTRYDVSVSSFVERDRLGIWLTDNRTDKLIAEWWDDDARQMFEDGRTFKERYDLKHWSVEYPSLADHMRSTLGFYAGKRCPSHMTDEQYRNTLKSREFARMKSDAERLLSKYEIGDTTLPSQTG